MKLPNAGRAFVEIQKLRDYCLNPLHPRGRHKARVFTRKLGVSAAETELLRAALLAAAREMDASLTREDDHGVRYVVDFTMVGPAGTGKIRSHWIVRRDEDFPRLTSCHVR